MSRIDDILNHIQEDCEDIAEFIYGLTEEQFLSRKIVLKAVAMSLINIGELVKILPPEFCQKYNSIPWKRMSGMRDIVAHKYKTLNMSAVWDVASDRIPEIKNFIKDYLQNQNTNIDI